MRELNASRPSFSVGSLLMIGSLIAEENEQYYWPPKDPLRAGREKKKKKVFLPENGPFTYGNNGFNPTLKPSNSNSQRENSLTASTYPPWHPDFGKAREDDEDGEEEDAAQAAGVDTGESCIPPGTIPGSGPSQLTSQQRWPIEEEDSESSSDEEGEETAKTLTSSRVRRGSEGYEVRPKRYDVAYAVQEERDDGYDDYEDDDEVNQYGYDNYDDRDEDKQWDWQRRQAEEEKLRMMLEEEMKRSGMTIAHDPPPEWQMPDHQDQTTTTSSSSSVLLPSQIMRRRSQWQEFNSQSHQQNQGTAKGLTSATDSL